LNGRRYLALQIVFFHAESRSISRSLVDSDSRWWFAF
jgi:hypothetical protein